MEKKISKSKLFPIFRHSGIINGKKISREIIHRPNISAIIAFNKNRILVVSQNRFPNGIDIEIPSGTVEKNETPIQAAHREFFEETGYRAKKMIPLTNFYSSIGYSTQKIFCFVAKDFTKISQLNAEQDEILSVKNYDFKKLLDMILKGKIKDSLTLSSVLFFAIKNNLI